MPRPDFYVASPSLAVFQVTGALVIIAAGLLAATTFKWSELRGRSLGDIYREAKAARLRISPYRKIAGLMDRDHPRTVLGLCRGLRLGNGRPLLSMRVRRTVMEIEQISLYIAPIWRRSDSQRDFGNVQRGTKALRSVRLPQAMCVAQRTEACLENP